MKQVRLYVLVREIIRGKVFIKTRVSLQINHVLLARESKSIRRSLSWEQICSLGDRKMVGIWPCKVEESKSNLVLKWNTAVYVKSCLTVGFTKAFQETWFWSISKCSRSLLEALKSIQIKTPFEYDLQQQLSLVTEVFLFSLFNSVISGTVGYSVLHLSGLLAVVCYGMAWDRQHCTFIFVQHILYLSFVFSFLCGLSFHLLLFINI